ncbi:uridine nucleosidase-like protein [Chaetomium sp. MPI-SDFR-AT-0129]|nr:uridine nucleosidase-like protein [Chaetomium sp. MPI-SDFR-AT-0129]
MNNDQFRRLLLANTSKSKSQSNPSPNNNGASSPPASSRPSSTAALGSRLKSSIPMTPRSVTGTSTNRSTFARQLAERDQETKPPSQSKSQFRSFAPKGSKPAQGYVDRARTREEQQQDEDDERAARLKVLEESFKKEEMDREMYDRLRAEVAGGDLGSTHLVKGLDFRLLERVRRGEDVFGGGGDGELHNGGGAGGEKEGDGGKGDGIEGEGEDPDDALERLEATEVKAVEREKVQKKGQFATTGLNPGQKRSRNQILAELKAARAAAAAAKAKEKEAESSLGSRFKKIGEKKTPGTRIERDGKGREVMIIVDEDGHERRKVRRVDPRVAAEEEERERMMLAASGEILGMEVPEEVRRKLEAQKAEEEGKKEIESIFEDAGSDYDPLAGLEGSDESSDEEEEGETKEEEEPQAKAGLTDMPPPPQPNLNNAGGAPASRNYFQDSKTALTSSETYKAPSLDDPAFRAALQKAKAAGALEKSAEEQKAAEREARLKQKLSELHRDDEDMDMGFGSSRVEDEADLEEGGGKVKLSTWGGGDGDGDEEGGGGGSGKTQQRKRGGKKRKGDKNNFEDVMRVMQRQKSSLSQQKRIDYLIQLPDWVTAPASAAHAIRSGGPSGLSPDDTRIPVWLDCDPGHDDTFAILLAAYHPAIRILGVSTVFGNASLEKTTQNATSILTALHKATTIPVHVGASHALVRPPMHAPTDIHGHTGLDGTDLLPTPTVPAITTPSAIDAAYTALRACPPGTAWVVATGAFTNVAGLFARYPDLVGHIKGLSLMGGALGDGFTDAVLGAVEGVPRVGNWTQFAEFNVLADPEAAEGIFGDRELAGKTTLIPLDLSHLVLTTEEVRGLLLYGPGGPKEGLKEGNGKGKTRLRTMLVELLMFFARTYSEVFGITGGPPLHDPLAVAAVLTGLADDPDHIHHAHAQHEIPFCDTDLTRTTNDAYHPPASRERFEVTVVTEGSYEEARANRAKTGQIKARLLPAGEKGVRIPRNLDIPLFWKVLEECVARADEAIARDEAAAATAAQ